MAKPNYSFEKRQRELAKQQKKKDKLLKKEARKASEQEANAPAPSETAEPAEPQQ